MSGCLRQVLLYSDWYVFISFVQFELEIQKVHEAYESLVKSSKKREYLEQVMKKRLEEDLKSARQQNESLVRQLEDAGLKVTDKRASRIEPCDSSMETLLARRKFKHSVFN